MTTPPDNNNRTLNISAPTEKGYKQQLAKIFCNPTANAARVIMDSNKNQSLDINDITAFLEQQTEAIKSGNLTQIDAMLLEQAYALQSVFLTMCSRMIESSSISAKQLYGNLAFKAQAQCRQSLQALADVKQPRHNTIINNKAHNQQVNVHEARLAELEACDTANMTNELLSEGTHAAVDRSRTPAAS